ncbi:fumarylacetoacetate hydrolase family protein [Nocardia asiatica]|uniref:fumarylacetoacetate hydrolase family protein n=1 Tax=Nocardia asiatica TaxID=209252 RepID=UPI00030A7957|nr:fumarylacetoacetate hydrolase family protein [Nocardia asiatica]
MPVPAVGTLLASHTATSGYRYTVRPGTTYLEAEIAVVIDTPLAGSPTRLEVARAARWLCPAIEVAAWAPRVVDGAQSPQHAIATHKSNGVVVLGDPRPAAEVADLRLEGVVLDHDGEIIGSAAGIEAMGHPFDVVAAIAHRLSRYDPSLQPGMVIMTGSLLKPFAVPRGSKHARAAFTRLGDVTVSFAGNGGDEEAAR